MPAALDVETTREDQVVAERRTKRAAQAAKGADSHTDAAAVATEVVLWHTPSCKQPLAIREGAGPLAKTERRLSGQIDA